MKEKHNMYRKYTIRVTAMRLEKEIKYSPNIFSKVLSIFLLGLGLFSPWIFKKWMPVTSPQEHSLYLLFILAGLGAILAIYSYEYYKHMIMRMMGVKSTLNKQLKPKTIVNDKVSRWQAVSISLAPFTDLTLVSLLMMVFGKSWLVIAFAVTFFTFNLLLSVRDIIIGYQLLKHVKVDNFVQLTPDGFEIWEENQMQLH